MEETEYWQKRNKEQAEKHAARLKELHEQHGAIPSLKEAYKPTRKPLEPRPERNSTNYALALGLPTNDPLRIEQARKHHAPKPTIEQLQARIAELEAKQ